MPGARIAVTLARGAAFSFACFAALLGGGLACIVATVGVCAGVGVLVYGAAHLFAYVFGFGFAWGLVIACWLLLLVPPVGALIHDLWMIRLLKLEAASPATEP